MKPSDARIAWPPCLRLGTAGVLFVGLFAQGLQAQHKAVVGEETVATFAVEDGRDSLAVTRDERTIWMRGGEAHEGDVLDASHTSHGVLVFYTTGESVRLLPGDTHTVTKHAARSGTEPQNEGWNLLVETLATVFSGRDHTRRVDVLQHGTGRGERAQARLLMPHGEAPGRLLSRTPTFSWLPAVRTLNRVRLYGDLPAGACWETGHLLRDTLVAGTALAWPDAWPPLKRGGTYRLELGPPGEALDDIACVTVSNEDEQATMAQTLEALHRSMLDQAEAQVEGLAAVQLAGHGYLADAYRLVEAYPESWVAQQLKGYLIQEMRALE